jgi:hypothetical protein
MKRIKALCSAVLMTVMLGLLAHTALASSSSTLTGTATTETGAALPSGSSVQILDSAGTARSVITSKAGTYSIVTNSLLPPILIQAGNLFGYSEAGAGTANIDPMSDLIVNQIFQALGTTPTAQFSATPPMTLTTAQIASATALMNLSLQQPLNNFKVKSGFDFFTTKFTVSSAFGKFLTHSTFGGFGTATETLDSTFGSVSYGATFWASTSPVGTWVNWTAQASGNTSQSSYYAYYPDEISAQLAYNGVGTFFKGYRSALKFEGKLLDAINLAPFYDDGSFLNDGKTVDIETGFQATFLRTVKVSSFTLGAITSFQSGVPDVSHNVIGVDYYIAKTDQGLKVNDLKNAYFVCDTIGSSCLFYGNQLSAGVDLKTTWELDSFSATPVLPFGTLKVSASAPTGTVDSIDITDNTFFTNQPLTSKGQKTDTYQPFHNGPTLNYVTDAWSFSHAVLPPPIDYSDPFSIQLNLPSSTPPPFIRYTSGYTNETINLIKPSLTGGHALGDFDLGKTLKVQWSLPLTYIVDNIRLSGKVCGPTMTQMIDSKPIKSTATSATIKLPKANGTEAVTDASFKLTFGGPRGERSMVVYGSNAACQ